MKVNALDIAPLCSGYVASYTNTVGNIAGFAAPQVASVFLKSGVSLSTPFPEYPIENFGPLEPGCKPAPKIQPSNSLS